MRWFNRLFFIAAFVGLAAIYVVQARRGAELSPAHKPAQGFSLPDLQGNRVALADYAGRPVLVNFWATWCPPCRAELPELEKLAQEKPGCLAVLGVAIESGSAAEVAAFVRERGLTYPILTGGESAASAYGVVTLPHSVLIDASGRAVGVYRGQLTREGVGKDVAALGGAAPRC